MCATTSRSIDTVGSVYQAQFAALYQAGMRDPHGGERSVQVVVPKSEKISKGREARRNIIVLPNIRLEQARVIRQTVKYFRPAHSFR